MSHSKRCKAEAPPGFCIGDDCTIDPEDYPALYETLREHVWANGIPLCGEVPGPGEYVWRGDERMIVQADGTLRSAPKPEACPHAPPRLRDWLVDRLFCTRCILPRLHPLHWLWCRRVGDW